VVIGEALEEAARRELREKTPLRDVYLEQLFTFGDPRRNPTAHVVSTAYWALIPRAAPAPRHESKYAGAAWWNVRRLPRLAYDHNRVARVALDRLRSKVDYTNVVYSLLPDDFTLGELQQIYEIIRGGPLDRRNFRKKFLASRLLKSLGKFRRGAHRPAALYAFRDRKLKRIELF
jgi:8-oxo-dGTP diphosphatase